MCCRGQGHRTYQINHAVGPTNLMYPNVWVHPGLTKMWMPSYWLRIRFLIASKEARTIKVLLTVRSIPVFSKI